MAAVAWLFARADGFAPRPAATVPRSALRLVRTAGATGTAPTAATTAAAAKSARATLARFNDLSTMLASGDKLGAAALQRCLDELEKVQAEIDAGDLWAFDTDDEEDSADAVGSDALEGDILTEGAWPGALLGEGVAAAAAAADTAGGVEDVEMCAHGDAAEAGASAGFESKLDRARDEQLFARAVRFYDPKFTEKREVRLPGGWG